MFGLAAAFLSVPVPVRADACTDSGGVTVSVAINGSNCVGGNGINPIYFYARGIIKFMSGLFGIMAVLMIIVAGFQLMTSQGNPDSIKKAKSRIANVVISIILFGLMFGILNYLIPGGIL